MTTEIIQTSLTVPYLLDQNDDLLVTQQGSLTVDGANAISNRSATDDHLDLFILGQVTATGLASPGQGASAVFLSSDLPSHNSVTVGTSGWLEALQGIGIASLGSASTIVNQGTIAAATGILVGQGDNRVDNTGTIIATDTAIAVGGFGIGLKRDFSVIHNTGTIQSFADPTNPGGSGWGIAVFADWARLINDGDISAHVAAFSQATHTSLINNRLISSDTELLFLQRYASLVNTGTITVSGVGSFFTGAVFKAVEAFASVVNSGTMSYTGARNAESFPGAISLGDQTGVGGRSTLNNSGTISSTSNGVDTWGAREIVNSGTISAGIIAISAIGAQGSQGVMTVLLNTGLIEGGNYGIFNDFIGIKVQNYGTISGALDPLHPGYSIWMNGWRGQIDNHGTLIGDVYIGSSQMTNSGAINGNVTFGYSTITNSGVITGDLTIFDEGTYIGVDKGIVTGSVNGSFSNDHLTGGNRTDRFFGNDGNDLMQGGGGQDLLNGGSGKDILTGGTGADSFLYTAATDSDHILGIDRITDFTAGVDKIDLSAFLSGATFIGAAGFSGAGPEVRYDAATGLLRADANGDGTADFWLILTNHAALTATDLIL